METVTDIGTHLIMRGAPRGHACFKIGPQFGDRKARDQALFKLALTEIKSELAPTGYFGLELRIDGVTEREWNNRTTAPPA
jgi:hypothetical protein